MADYNYEETEFVGLGGNPIDLEGLQQQVLASGITSAGLSYINQYSGTVTFTFDQTLSTSSPDDVALLDNVVATHDGTHQIVASGDTILSYSFSDTDGTPLKTLNSTYTRSATVVFEGTDFYEATPARVTITGYAEGTTVGGVRLYDLDNDIIVASKEDIDSNDEAVIEIPITGEWPEDRSTLELQIKRVSGIPLVNYFVVSSLQIIF